MRPGLHQPAAGRQHESVLVVQRRVLDRDRDIACRKPAVIQRLDGSAHLAVGPLGQHQRAERHDISSPCLLRCPTQTPRGHRMIKFYYNLAPNPTKVALALEEMGLPYELVPVDTR